MNNKNFLPYIILLLPPLFWAGNFIAGRAVADLQAPLTLSFYRWFLALIILLPFTLMPLWRQRAIIIKYFWQITILAVLSITGFNSLVYIALQNTTATNATILNSFIPIFILLISGVFLNEAISSKQIIGVLVSLLGVAAIITRLDMAIIMHLSINQGDLWMLLATLDWALYSLLLKYLRPSEMTPPAFLSILVLIGTLALLPIYLLNPLNEASVAWEGKQLKVLIYIAIFPSIVSYLAWNYGMQKLGAAVGGQFIYLMPFFGAIMAIVLLDEVIHLYHLIGGLLIALGLWLSISTSNQTDKMKTEK